MNPILLPPDDPRAPKFWLHETTGVLKPVVRAYLTGHALDSVQIGLMRAYLEQWFDSPVWGNRNWTEIDAIRRRVHAITSNEDIRGILKDALDLGIDPL